MSDAMAWTSARSGGPSNVRPRGQRRVPASIQSHGFLVCLDDGCRIMQASENVAALAQRPLDEVLGAPLAALTGADAARRIADAVSARGVEGAARYLGTLADPRGAARSPLAIAVHRCRGMPIVEFEPSDPPADMLGEIHPLVARGFVGELQSAETTGALAALAVRELRRLTGFGRVLLVRYDDAQDAHVVAEDKADAYTSYLDQRFLASAIPKRARERYGRNRIRVVADTHCRAARLMPAVNPATGVSADLSFATLRSVSSAHRDQLAQMGVRASLSVPIVVRGKLWGSIACQHAQPRVPPFDVRIACETIGQVLSLRIEASEERADVDYRVESRRALTRMLERIAEHDHFIDGLCAEPESILGIASASGVAIVFEGRVERIGVTPDEPTVLAFADWLVASRADVFATECLADDCPDLRCDPRWTGMLAVSISKLFRHCVIWFRPERVRTIHWVDGSHDGQHARHEQAHGARLEIVRGRSQPWALIELEIAGEFRAAMLGIVLKRAEEMAQRAADLGRANQELEAFSYSVSHDLRAPLRHIVGYGELLVECDAPRLSERGLRFLKNILDSARFAGTLVDDLLTFSLMGRAALRPARVAMRALVDAIVREQAADAPGRHIDWRIGALPDVTGDAAFLQLAVRNLVANAVKYTSKREHAVIEIGADAADDEHVFFVRDNGVGFNMKYAGKLFGVFQRLHRFEDFEGTGIGLANVRRVIERHDGRTWAEGEPERGATFFFTLPRRAPPQPDGPGRPSKRKQ
jgi:light-regulated signal transduction histidine kinase (bacteriophytochrome)